MQLHVLKYDRGAPECPAVVIAPVATLPIGNLAPFPAGKRNANRHAAKCKIFHRLRVTLSTEFGTDIDIAEPKRSETVLERSGTQTTHEAEAPAAPPAAIGPDDLRAAINELVPFQKFVGARLAELGADGAVATLPDAPHLLNHVGTGHAAALFLVAEAAAGGALAGALRERVTTVRFVLRASEIRYHRAARGQLRAVADVSAEDVRAKCSRLAAGERFEEVVSSLLYDPAGDHVASAQFTYHCRILPG